LHEPAFRSCGPTDAAALAEIERERNAARALGITRTPTLFVNGRSVAGGAMEPRLRELVDEEFDRIVVRDESERLKERSLGRSDH